jgi:undecaprenyl-diphosphatase
MRWSRRDAATPHDGWTSEVSSALALAGFLFRVFLGFTLLAMGPLVSIDSYFNLAAPPRGWVPVLHVMDRIGQRAVCLPVLTAAMALSCWHVRSWRPAWLVAGAVFSLNLLVLILKLALGRGQPEAANPAFFVGGMAYPSGHTSNIVLVYGLAAYLLGNYRQVGRAARRAMWGLVGLLGVTMVVTSMTLSWHWFADLIAGLLIGGTVLELTVAVDAALPAGALSWGPLRVLAALRGLLRPGRNGPPAAEVEEERPATLPRHDAPRTP